MKLRVAALGVGFVTALFLAVVATGVGFVTVRSVWGQEGLGGIGVTRMLLECGGWLVGSFAGALLAQRLGAALSTLHAAVFGLTLFAVNGLYFLAAPMPLVFWATGALACVGGSVAGARATLLEPPVAAEAARSSHEEANSRVPAQTVADLLAASLSQRSFLQRTGQARKYSATNAVILTGGGLMFGGWLLLTGDSATVTSMVGVVVGLAGLAFQCLAIRCPRCGTKVVWHALSTRPHSEASYWAEYQQVCPKCGYDPE